MAFVNPSRHLTASIFSNHRSRYYCRCRRATLTASYEAKSTFYVHLKKITLWSDPITPPTRRLKSRKSVNGEWHINTAEIPTLPPQFEAVYWYCTQGFHFPPVGMCTLDLYCAPASLTFLPSCYYNDLAIASTVTSFNTSFLIHNQCRASAETSSPASPRRCGVSPLSPTMDAW